MVRWEAGWRSGRSRRGRVHWWWSIGRWRMRGRTRGMWRRHRWRGRWKLLNTAAFAVAPKARDFGTGEGMLHCTARQAKACLGTLPLHGWRGSWHQYGDTAGVIFLIEWLRIFEKLCIRNRVDHPLLLSEQGCRLANVGRDCWAEALVASETGVFKGSGV